MAETERAKEWLQCAGIFAPDDPVIQFNSACNLARLGEVEKSLDLLENAARNMSNAILGWLKDDTDLIPLRDHPRYKALIAREEARFASEH
jgi:adenylate cyclase